MKKRSLSQGSDNYPAYGEISRAFSSVSSRKVSIIKKAWNTLQRFRKWIGRKMYQKLPNGLKKIVKKIERIEAKLHKLLVCLTPRLKRRYGQLVYPEGLTVKSLVEKKQCGGVT